MPPVSLTFPCFPSFAGIDREAFAELIEDGFSRRLTPDYFDQVQPVGVYLALEAKKDEPSPRYLGAAVVEAIPGLPHVHYLDKLVVAADKQRNGVGTGLFQEIQAAYPQLVWRAHPESPFHPFYQRHTLTRAKVDGWFIYGTPNINLLDMLAAREYAIQKPRTLEELT